MELGGLYCASGHPIPQTWTIMRFAKNDKISPCLTSILYGAETTGYRLPMFQKMGCQDLGTGKKDRRSCP